MNGFPLLTAIILLPAIGAVVVALLPRSRSELVRPVAVAFTVATLALTLSMLAGFETGEGGFQFTSFRIWIEQWGIAWNLGTRTVVDVVWPAESAVALVGGIDALVRTRGTVVQVHGKPEATVPAGGFSALLGVQLEFR